MNKPVPLLGNCSLQKWSESPLHGDTPPINQPGVYQSGVNIKKPAMDERDFDEGAPLGVFHFVRGPPSLVKVGLIDFDWGDLESLVSWLCGRYLRLTIAVGKAHAAARDFLPPDAKFPVLAVCTRADSQGFLPLGFHDGSPGCLF